MGAQFLPGTDGIQPRRAARCFFGLSAAELLGRAAPWPILSDFAPVYNNYPWCPPCSYQSCPMAPYAGGYQPYPQAPFYQPNAFYRSAPMGYSEELSRPTFSRFRKTDNGKMRRLYNQRHRKGGAKTLPGSGANSLPGAGANSLPGSGANSLPGSPTAPILCLVRVPTRCRARAPTRCLVRVLTRCLVPVQTRCLGPASTLPRLKFRSQRRQRRSRSQRRRLRSQSRRLPLLRPSRRIRRPVQ